MIELTIISSLLGLSFGSFVNVCAYRLPRGISVISVRSFCPHCNHHLRWHELLPLLSFILSQGKCNNCKNKISFIYPLIELFVCVIAVWTFWQYGISLVALRFLTFFLVMLIIALIDWQFIVIPNQVIIIGVPMGLGINLVEGKDILINSIVSSVIAIVVLLAVMLLGNMLFKKQSMGMGDIKLAGVIGLFLGYQEFLVALWLAAIIGTFYAILVKRLNLHSSSLNLNSNRLPFGSFLSVVSVVIYIFQQNIQRIIETWLMSSL